MIVNNVVLRTDLAGNPPFRELLNQVQQLTREAHANQDVPFDRVVEAVQPQRDTSRNPLFQVMFGFHDSYLPELTFPGLTVELHEVLSNQSAKFDLNLIVIPRSEQRIGQRSKEGAEGITVIWEYNTDLFDHTTVIRMAEHYKNLLEAVAASPNLRLAELLMLTDREKHQLLLGWNDTRRDYAPHRCIHELFEAQAEQTPETLAVVFGDRQLTYRELNRRANQLAHYFRKRGVRPDVLVGISMERSPDMLVGLLGILKAGGAYVPLDPSYPSIRSQFMIQDSGIAVLLTASSLKGAFSGDGPQATGNGQPVTVGQSPVGSGEADPLTPDTRDVITISLDQAWSSVALEATGNPPASVSADNLAYVIYTSGSTGIPKGVAIQHRGAVNLLYWAKEHYTSDDLAGVLAASSICFDLSVFELFAPLSWGGSVVLTESTLQVPSVRHAVTLVNSVPSVLTELLRAHELPASVRTVNLAGEPLPTSLVDQISHQGTVERIFDLYGPSEATTYSTSAPRESNGPPTIGRPIANTQIYILDGEQRLLPVGVTGEILIGGSGLAQGYLERSALTAGRFVPNPYGQEPGTRLYRSGDLARFRPDGNIEFLGRLDHQVKVRGFRVEPGEVEAALEQHPTLREAVVMAGDDGNTQRLIAYVVPRKRLMPEVSELRRFLQTKLPQYMVPSVFVELDALPLTPNGKLNRQALPEPKARRPRLKEAYVPPQTSTEQRLAEIWAALLPVDRVGLHDNFFDLGGHSLLATQMTSRILDSFKVELQVLDIFENPTLAGIAQSIETIQWAIRQLLIGNEEQSKDVYVPRNDK